MSSIEAQYYLQKGETVECRLCPHRCHISEGKSGICGVRENRKGKLYSTIYGEVTSMAMDPIEKKPLYHFYPGSEIFSIGTKGCNLRCPFCQNWSISQDLSARSSYRSPEEIVKMAEGSGSFGIAYTYSEPTIWFEFVKDCSLAAKERGLKNVLVTNGFVNPEPLKEMTGFIDAMNIDLKCYSHDTYKKVLKAGLDAVKETIKGAHAGGCHVEVTTLVVPGMNDNMKELVELAEFIASVDKKIPWHLSRYYPSYKYEKPATNVSFLTEVWEEGNRILDFVFTGNVHPSESRSDTVCPNCNTVIISRTGYHTVVKELENGKCKSCGHELGIIH
ncbi:MAG TPA: AmmeMemoRadiSam system radical SAM enzyme [Spirochaetota bacterium]|nr:AmmeMemoRadiSam system radical SAM enzyme [Spirochaetota bacterium]